MARYGEACKYALANPSVLHTNYYQDFFLVELLQFYVKINPEKSSLKNICFLDWFVQVRVNDWAVLNNPIYNTSRSCAKLLYTLHFFFKF